MDAKTLRQRYIEFFKSKSHVWIPSASLIPDEEAQLESKEKVLFTTAGMQPLIPYLLGRPHPKGRRLVNYQKCLRTGDIDEVGDLVHHTFFEMLGNWSLGDYFKKEAIEYSFEFLTKELGIAVDKLAISVFAGDDESPKDVESAQIWESLGVPKERIVYLGKDDNWWPKGAQSGLCGPSTEIFYWTGEGMPEGLPPDLKWVEIWNDVFMQFNRGDDGKLIELSQKNVDTGMGLERTVAVLKGVNNYETDLFKPLIEAIEKVLGCNYGRNEKVDRRIRIIADHLRAVAFMIADGVVPANKERGYVLRRLIRRAITHAYLISEGATSLFPVMDVSIHQYKDIYPELAENEDAIREIFTTEEAKFKSLLKSGLAKFGRDLATLKGEQFSGKTAFDLYQNHGFPIELTQELLSEKGFSLNTAEYESEYKHHQVTSRQN
ncbi:alanine--tRNA ligase [Candidatus Daviesbacteria bacterium]|nr:alanine--tRNA ligase [Candidatus Daviesbacteria bacterium]